MTDAAISDLRSEHRTEPVPSEAHGFVTDIEAALEQHIFDLSQRQRIPDVHHHREPDHVGRTVEITEGIGHLWKLPADVAHLKPTCSDNARATYRRECSIPAPSAPHTLSRGIFRCQLLQNTRCSPSESVS